MTNLYNQYFHSPVSLNFSNSTNHSSPSPDPSNSPYMYRNAPQRLPSISSNSPLLNIPKGFSARPSNLFAGNIPGNNGFHVHNLSANTEALLIKNIQPGIRLEKQSEAPVNYINLYFRQSPFNEINYLQRLLNYQSQNLSTINKAKTRFYKLGTNTNASTEIMVYIGHRDSSPYFCKLNDFSVIQPRNIKFYGGLQKLVTSSIEDLKKVGWIVLNGNNWGFLLDLESLEEARKGNLPGHWQRLIRTEFFLKQLKKAEKEGDPFSENNRRDDDKSIIPSIITPINEKLMVHQRDDINWMHNLEKDHSFELQEKAKGMPFFNTGYCFSKDLTKLSKQYTTKGKIQIQGGILNNQTGSGKTASIIGLITSSEQQKPSLVIATEYTLYQWQEEFKKFAPNLRVLTFAEWSDLDQTSLHDYDVILTHRKIIEEGKAKFTAENYNISFKRIIFDEIQEILSQYNKKKEVAKKFRNVQNQYPAQQESEFNSISNIYDFLQTVRKLQKEFIWGVSSSCISSEINPAFFNLIGLDASSYSSEISDDIKTHFFQNHFRVNTAKVTYPDLNKSIIKSKPYQVQSFYSKLTLPNQAVAKRAGGKQLVEFRNLEKEPDSVAIAVDMIDKKQEDEINKIQIEIASNFEEENEHTKALERRIQSLQGQNNFYAEAIQLLLGSQFECPICLAEQPMEKIVMFSCLHQLCDHCYTQIGSIPKCPICKEITSDKDLIMHPRYRGPKENKLTSLIKQIQEVPAEEKVVIFTQFHALLGVITHSFGELKVPHLVLKGDAQEISKTLRKFKEDPNEKVLLLSVEQGTSGIDLSEANHVFFAHPFFERDGKKAGVIYNQCIGRVLRLGQKRKVNVKLLVTQSVEDEATRIFIES